MSAAFLMWPILLAFQTQDPCASGAQAAAARNLQAAAELLSKCVQSPAAPLEAFLMLCGVHQAQRNEAALFATAREGMRRFPEDRRFYLTAGVQAARAKQYREAVEILEAGHRRWRDDEKLRSLLASAWFARGTELLDAGNNEEAADALQRSTALVPDDPEAHLNLGRAWHNLHRFEKALAAFDRVLEIRPATPLARFHRGLALYSLGEFDRAIADLDAEIASGGGYPPAYLVRGLSRLSRGNAEDAVRDLDLAAARMPDSAAAQVSFARALMRLDRLQEAEARLRRAIELDAGDPATWNMLISVLNRSGRSDEARALAPKAAELARKSRSAKPGEIRFEDAGRSGR